jgi:flagellin-like hook-associated protein FlgL
MPIVINTNAAASTASFNLSKNAEALRKSLARLSSGNRITQPAEDAGGMAVAYRLDSQKQRSEAVLNNHQNALSYLQVQDGALETVANVVNRMSELRTMAADITKNSSDIENYSKEFRELQDQLKQVSREKFNGISLFSQQRFDSAFALAGEHVKDSGPVTESYTYEKPDVGANAAVHNNVQKYEAQLLTHPSGVAEDGSIDLNVVNLEKILTLVNSSIFDNDTTAAGPGSLGTDATSGADLGDKTVNLMGKITVDTANSLAEWYDPTNVNADGKINTAGLIQDITTVSQEEFNHIIQKIADARAENGAEQQRVQQSYDLHSTNLVNLEAAHGRIMDVDVALESTRFAKNNVLVQASASMTAQANQLTQVALTLLQ